MTAKKIIVILVAATIILLVESEAMATIVDIFATTNKPVYELGEEVVVSVIAYNPNPEPVTLGFVDALQASYLMDNTYDWKDHHGAWLVVTEQRIEAFSPHTWTLVHGADEMETYLPTLGTHTIVGEVLGYGQSTPVGFEVVPEPATMLILCIGIIGVRWKHRNK